jgi:hypothetical protein
VSALTQLYPAPSSLSIAGGGSRRVQSSDPGVDSNCLSGQHPQTNRRWPTICANFRVADHWGVGDFALHSPVREELGSRRGNSMLSQPRIKSPASSR